jgi:hypothetical protein
VAVGGEVMGVAVWQGVGSWAYRANCAGLALSVTLLRLLHIVTHDRKVTICSNPALGGYYM